MSVAVIDATKVKYCVIVTKEEIDGVNSVLYGVEGFDGSRKTVIPALSYDRDRIIALVDDLNRVQFDLQKLNELVSDHVPNKNK